MPKQFAGFRPVSAFRTGVLGTTGVESAEAVRGLVEQVKPSLVIAVDACLPADGAGVRHGAAQRHRIIPAPAWATTGRR